MSSSHYRWTVAIQKHFDARVAALARVPYAQPHEAPNSWLMRVAALQGCAAMELANYLGFTFRADFDLQYYFVFRKTPPEAPQVQGLEQGRMFVSLPRRSTPLGTWMRAPYDYRGRYRFCPLCLKFDRVPCIRLYARMEELVFCPWHRCLLEKQCPNCNAHVDLIQDMASAGPKRRGVEDLSRCLSCGDPLYAMGAVPVDYAFVQKLPFWLRNWGRTGPEAVLGPGLPREELRQEYLRLTSQPPVISPFVAAQHKAMAKLLAKANARGRPSLSALGSTHAGPSQSHGAASSGEHVGPGAP